MIIPPLIHLQIHTEKVLESNKYSINKLGERLKH